MSRWISDDEEGAAVLTLPSSVDAEVVRLARLSAGVPVRDWPGNSATRDVMNLFLGTRGGDFSIHDDPAARAAAALVGAPAFCYRGNVFLGSTPELFGTTLPQVLRHELVHVAQVQNARRTGRIDPPEKVEREALHLCRGSGPCFDTTCRASPDRFWFWNPDGHCIITQNALNAALPALAETSKYKQWGISGAGLGRMMTWMPLNNCTEDVDWGNFSGHIPGDPLGRAADYLLNKYQNASPLTNYMAHACAVILKGDQVRHFMVSLDEDAEHAYWISINHIKEACTQAWMNFNKAFPRRGGLLGAVSGAWLEFSETHVWDLVVGDRLKGYLGTEDENVGDEHGHGMGSKIGAVGGAYALGQERDTAFSKAQHYLGAACHTLQDSFSPAHTRRSATNEKLVETIYAYDKINQDPTQVIGPSASERTLPGDFGWPGHETLDRWIHNNYTRRLKNLAEQATIDLIICVMYYVHADEGTFKRELHATLMRHATFCKA